jgi:A/G-specific adenine glycosylase
MLQQTQVRTVLPYYDRFLALFPDVGSLAAASEEEVVASWAGLGYYSRARNIHRAARKIAGDLAGVFPSTLDQWLELPGIGKYTAGAILSIAFNQPHPVVDGNVRRVISRIHGLESPPRESFFWAQASAWLPRNRPSDFNQAMMELGALVCLPSRPRCAGCPVASLCAARKLGIQESIPAPAAPRRVESVELVVLVIERPGSILVTSDAPATYIPGPNALPSRVLRPGETPRQGAKAVARRLELPIVQMKKILEIRHSITFRRIRGHVFAAQTLGEPAAAACAGLRWVSRAAAGRLLTSSLFRKALS